MSMEAEFFGEPNVVELEPIPTGLDLVLMGRVESIPARLPVVLDKSRRAFEGGDKSQLMETVYVCAFFHIPIPAWAADALLDLRDGIVQGNIRSLDDALGRPLTSVAARKKQAKLRRLASDVLTEMARLRSDEGGTPTMADLFERTAQNLMERGTKVGRGAVRDIYNAWGKDWIKQIPSGGGGREHFVSGGHSPMRQHPARPKPIQM